MLQQTSAVSISWLAGAPGLLIGNVTVSCAPAMQALMVGTPRHSPGPGLLSKLTLLCAPALQASVGWQASPPPKPKAAGAKRKAPEELDKVKAEAEELGFKVGHGCQHC